MAAGRFRPARLRRSGGATGSIGTGSIIDAPSDAGSSTGAAGSLGCGSLGCCTEPRACRPWPAGGSLEEGSVVIGCATSDLEQLGLLVLEQVVDRGDVLVRHLLELLLGTRDVVLAGLAVLGQLVEGVLRVA